MHREGVEATPYLPNVIVSTSPYMRPRDYGIPLDAMGAEERTGAQRQDGLGPGEADGQSLSG